MIRSSHCPNLGRIDFKANFLSGFPWSCRFIFELNLPMTFFFVSSCNLLFWIITVVEYIFVLPEDFIVCSEHFRQDYIIRKLSGRWGLKKGMWIPKTDTKTSWQIFHCSCIRPSKQKHVSRPDSYKKESGRFFFYLLFPIACFLYTLLPSPRSS